MSLDWSWVFIGGFTALGVRLFAGSSKPPQFKWLQWRGVHSSHFLPLLLQLTIVGLISGLIGAFGIVIYRFVFNQPIDLDPLLWALGWLFGTLLGGIIRRPAISLPTDQV